jgi:hypothetical protein
MDPMNNKISQDKVDALLKFAYDNVPDLEIVYKDEPLPTRWMAFLFMWANLVGRFSKSFKRKWENDISNAVAPKYLVFPSRSTYGDLTEYHAYALFRHELVHLIDMRKHGWGFNLTYILFPFPLFFAGRSHWEFRAYTQNLLVRFEEFGIITDSTLSWVESQYTGSLYLWMWPWKKSVKRKLKSLRLLIETGEVQGFYPDVSWWKL